MCFNYQQRHGYLCIHIFSLIELCEQSWENGIVSTSSTFNQISPHTRSPQYFPYISFNPHFVSSMFYSFRDIFLLIRSHSNRKLNLISRCHDQTRFTQRQPAFSPLVFSIVVSRLLEKQIYIQ